MTSYLTRNGVNRAENRASLGECAECGKALQVYVYSGDGSLLVPFDIEARYPCDGCGAPTCGSFHTEARTEPDGEGSYFVEERLCPGCVSGNDYRATVTFEYNRSRGV